MAECQAGTSAFVSRKHCRELNDKAGDGMNQDFSRAIWFKSSYSNSQGGSCVEVCTSQPGTVGIRDSKNMPGPQLAVTSQTWTRFIHAIKNGELEP